MWSLISWVFVFVRIAFAIVRLTLSLPSALIRVVVGVALAIVVAADAGQMLVSVFLLVPVVAAVVVACMA